jgi:Tfp pilus assembly protein PilO
MKSTIAENIDIPSFMKMVDTESRKLGLNVVSLKPLPPVPQENYTEHVIQFAFKGIYAQVVNFLERMSNVNDIVRVEAFNFSPLREGKQGRFIVLDGTMELKTFTYLQSSADNLKFEALPGPKNQANPPGGVVPTSSSPPGAPPRPGGNP